MAILDMSKEVNREAHDNIQKRWEEVGAWLSVCQDLSEKSEEELGMFYGGLNLAHDSRKSGDESPCGVEEGGLLRWLVGRGEAEGDGA